MSNLSSAIKFIFSHKKKYLITVLAFIFFVALFFPYQDLGDLATSWISKGTQNQVYLTVSNLSPSIFPNLSLSAEDLTVETPQFPAVSVKEIQVQPSWGALITQKPDGKLIARGLFRGDVEIDVRPGKKTEAGNPTHSLNLTAQHLSLAELQKIARLPMMLKGQAQLKLNGTADPSFQDQPDFDIDLHVDKFELPAGAIETQLGPVQLPQIRLSQVELKGRLSAGRFQIEKALAGKNGDDLFANIKGGLNFQVQNRGNQMVPVFGAYQLDIDLSLQKNLYDKISAFLVPLDNHRISAEGASVYQYKFKVSATSFDFAPQISSLR